MLRTKMKNKHHIEKEEIRLGTRSLMISQKVI